jgi:hypothetical protein
VRPEKVLSSEVACGSESPASYFPDSIARQIAAWSGRGDLPLSLERNYLS